MAYSEIGLSSSRRAATSDNRAKDVLKHICKELMTRPDASVTLKSLSEVFMGRDESQLVSFLKEYQFLFEITPQPCGHEMLRTVQPKTDIRLCGKHLELAGSCSGHMCNDLHICKFYLCSKGGCNYPDFGKKSCRYLHDLKSAHNWPILQKNLLDELSVQEIQFMFSLKPRKPGAPKNAVPIPCKFYNTSGCDKPTSCQFLHLCSHFILGSCQYQSCTKCHDLKAQQPRALLSKNGIDPSQKEASEILEILRKSLNKARAKRKRITPSESDESEICSSFLRDECRFGASCFNLHPSSKLPYQWQVIPPKSGRDVWADVEQAANVSLETAYCDPKQSDYSLPIDGVSCTVDFDTMTLQAGYKIRRLSTSSSVRNSQKHNIVSTKWIWYWEKAKDCWEEYGRPEDNSHSEANVTSDDLEISYLTSPGQEVQFATDSFKYAIDFPKMEQRNVGMGTKRKIRRRPVLETSQSLQEKLKCMARREDEKIKEQITLSRIVPDTWENKSLNNKSFFKVQVFKTGTMKAEFEEIENFVLENLRAKGEQSIEVKAIFRIENLRLLWRFDSMKTGMKKSDSPGQNLERRLFHGTKDKYMDAICQQGFDFRVSGLSTGTLFGHGSYFSVSAKYSLSYSDSKKLFIARVLSGDFVEGRGDYRRPPEKPQSTERFDSCVDRVDDPTMFIVFDTAQAYPEYIVQL